MPRDDRVFSVLLACPADVQDEAELVHEAVEEVNRGVGALQGVRLEVVDWQTHASPGIASDAQNVINRQLPDYDIFLGVMWARFGTATPRAGSGTEEEFDRALVRYKEDPNGMKILFYFKQAPLPLDAIDLAQLQKVREFRERLKHEGVLYREFGSSEEFSRQLRQHLGQQLVTPSTSGNGENANDSQTLHQEQEDAHGDAQNDDNGDELGFLDYVDRAEEQFSESRAVTERMGTTITEIGNKIRQRTEEMQDAVVGGTQLSRQEARVLFGKAADDMNCFSDKLTKDLPSFRDTLSDGVAATRQAAWLVPDGPNRDAQLKKVIDDLGGLRDGLEPAIDGMVAFQGSVQSLPKMTRELNVAKKRVSAVLARIIREGVDSGRDTRASVWYKRSVHKRLATTEAPA